MNFFPIFCLIGVVVIITMGAVYSEQMYRGIANETQSEGINSTVDEKSGTQYEIDYSWTLIITAILIVIIIILVFSLFL